MKQLLFIILFTSISFAQDFTTIYKGKTETIAGQVYEFTNLKKNGDEVEFINNANNSKVFYLLNSLKYIIDSNGTLKYQNPGFYKTPEQIALDKQKIIERENKLKEELANRKKLDSIFGKNYPQGIYETMESFLNQKPSKISDLYIEAVDKDNFNATNNNLPDYCNIMYKENDRRVKNVFAVSYNGNLFFQIKAIIKNKSSDDSFQSNDKVFRFIKAKKLSNKYIYCEGEFANELAQLGVLFGGGLIAYAALNKDLHKQKALVWDYDKKEFNIILNCEDFNFLANEIDQSQVLQCDKDKFSIENVRKLFQIKN